MNFQEQRQAVQRALQPFYKGPIDGEFGPLTEAALHALKTATDTVPALLPLPAAGTNPRLAMVRELRELIGGREVTPNQSPEINALWQYTSYPSGWRDRAPYCAATLCACAHRAAKKEPRLAGFPMPTSPSVAGLLEWAQQRGSRCLVFRPGERPALAGDIVIFLPKISHCALLAADHDGGSSISTFEGNTNGAGSRDGDGFWAKTRNVSLAGHFIRIAAA